MVILEKSSSSRGTDKKASAKIPRNKGNLHQSFGGTTCLLFSKPRAFDFLQQAEMASKLLQMCSYTEDV